LNFAELIFQNESHLEKFNLSFLKWGTSESQVYFSLSMLLSTVNVAFQSQNYFSKVNVTSQRQSSFAKSNLLKHSSKSLLQIQIYL
jgi:hypothetical protein